jgi:hypothetical protein
MAFKLKKARHIFPKEEISSWRHQAVYEEYDGNREYSICEVYLDKEGKFVTCTTSHHIGPLRFGLNGLIESLQRMMDEVHYWKVVPFKSLKPGMVFEHAE